MNFVSSSNRRQKYDDKNLFETNFFWLNYERIINSILPFSLPPQINITTLKQIILQKKKSNRIKLIEWTEIAKKCFNLPCNISEVLFLNFETLNNENPENQITTTRIELSSLKKNQHVEFLRKRSVHLGSFFIFLWFQVHFNNENFNLNRLQSQPDVIVPYSNTNSFSDLPPTKKVELSLKLKDKQSNFIKIFKKYLKDLVFMLSNCEKKIDAKTVNRLQYFLESGRRIEKKTRKQFNQLFPFWVDKNYDKLIDVEVVCNFINSRLVMNHYLYPELKFGFSQQNTNGGNQNELIFQKNEIYVENIKKNKILNLIGINKKTFLNQNYEKKILKIIDCKNSFIYSLTPHKYVNIYGCSKITIVLAPVQKIVSLEYCFDVKLIVPCRIIRISNCANCILYICVNCPPIIIDNCENIVLAPYNTYYDDLKKHLKIAGVNPRINQFQTPYLLQTGKRKNYREICSVLNPKEFSQFVIPFNNNFDGKNNIMNKPKINPCVIPKEYAEEIQKKMQSIAQLYASIKSNTDDGEIEVENVVRFMNQKFKEWLVKTGRVKVISTLMNFENEKQK